MIIFATVPYPSISLGTLKPNMSTNSRAVIEENLQRNLFAIT